MGEGGNKIYSNCVIQTYKQRCPAVQCCFNSASDPYNGQTPNSISKPPKVIESRT